LGGQGQAGSFRSRARISGSRSRPGGSRRSLVLHGGSVGRER
jgi:hypothetical protein